jgi:hypothetical protein
MGDGMRRATSERRAGGGMHAARGPLAVGHVCGFTVHAIHCLPHVGAAHMPNMGVRGWVG